MTSHKYLHVEINNYFNWQVKNRIHDTTKYTVIRRLCWVIRRLRYSGAATVLRMISKSEMCGESRHVLPLAVQ